MKKSLFAAPRGKKVFHNIADAKKHAKERDIPLDSIKGFDIPDMANEYAMLGRATLALQPHNKRLKKVAYFVDGANVAHPDQPEVKRPVYLVRGSTEQNDDKNTFSGVCKLSGEVSNTVATLYALFMAARTFLPVNDDELLLLHISRWSAFDALLTRGMHVSRKKPDRVDSFVTRIHNDLKRDRVVVMYISDAPVEKIIPRIVTKDKQKEKEEQEQGKGDDSRDDSDRGRDDHGITGAGTPDEEAHAVYRDGADGDHADLQCAHAGDAQQQQ